ncbi:MAG: hypothetical protein IKA60_03720, partial [Rikenellaceae bacterium]|nr:hypothetical protein [Rikenellaceae bacterium]
MSTYTVLFKTKEDTAWKPCRKNATFATEQEAEEYISTCIMYSSETEYKIEDLGLPVDSTLEESKDADGYSVYYIKYDKNEIRNNDDDDDD